MSTEPVAYLASEYPGISHTFILREVAALRQQDIPVRTLSINRPRHLEIMTEEEKREAGDTLYIKSVPFTSILMTHIRLAFTMPAAYLQMVVRALRCWSPGPLSLFKAVAYFAEAGVLLDWMRGQGVAHVHVHFANPAATVAFIAEASRAISYSVSVHGPDVFYNVDINLLSAKVHRARFVRCISWFCRSQVQRLIPHSHWDKCPIVRCGVDPAKFAPRPDPGNKVAELLCVGRLVPAKGQHVLLRACRMLADKGVPFHLTLVGDGPDRESLEALSEELAMGNSVTFAGAVGQGEIQRYYDQADVFVLASFAEGLPVVLMEAMAKEIPCVSTRIVAIPELIKHGENGLLVPPSDSVGLADALKRLVEDPALRARFGKKARESVLKGYDLDKNCAGMATVFRQFVLREHRT